MQLIAEAYDLLAAAGLSSRPRSPTSSASGTAASWSRSSSRSPPRCSTTSTRRPASRSSTSSSTRPSRRAPAAGPCRSPSTSASRSPAIAEAVFARSPSGPRRAARGGRAAPRRPRAQRVDRRATASAFVDDVRDALYASKIVAYAQGFDQIRAGERGVRLGHRPRRRWPRSGAAAASSGRGSSTGSATRTPPSRARHPAGGPELRRPAGRAAGGWRRVVAAAATAGRAGARLLVALAYYDSAARASGCRPRSSRACATTSARTPTAGSTARAPSTRCGRRPLESRLRTHVRSLPSLATPADDVEATTWSYAGARVGRLGVAFGARRSPRLACSGLTGCR